MGSKIPKEVIIELSKAFDKYDANGDGMFRREELMMYMQSINNLPSTEIAALVDDFIKAADTNKDGIISKKEFMKYTKSVMEKALKGN